MTTTQEGRRRVLRLEEGAEGIGNLAGLCSNIAPTPTKKNQGIMWNTKDGGGMGGVVGGRV